MIDQWIDLQKFEPFQFINSNNWAARQHFDPIHLYFVGCFNITQTRRTSIIGSGEQAPTIERKVVHVLLLRVFGL